MCSFHNVSTGLVDVLGHVLVRVPLECHTQVSAICKEALEALRSKEIFLQRRATGWGPELRTCRTHSGASLVQLILRLIARFPLNMDCNEGLRAWLHGAEPDLSRLSLDGFIEACTSILAPPRPPLELAEIRVGGGPKLAGIRNCCESMENFYIHTLDPRDASPDLQNAWWTVARRVFDGSPLPESLTVLSLFRRDDGVEENPAEASFQALIWNGVDCGLIDCKYQDLQPLPHCTIESWAGVPLDWVQNFFLATLADQTTQDANLCNFTGFCNVFRSMLDRNIPKSWYDSWCFARGTVWEGWHDGDLLREDMHGVERIDYLERTFCWGYTAPVSDNCPFVAWTPGKDNQLQQWYFADTEEAAITTEDIQHIDAPAVIDPFEAAVISQQRWAGSVEMLAESRMSAVEARRENDTFHLNIPDMEEAAITTEDIQHVDAPAVIDPVEAAVISQQRWAGSVEMLAESGVSAVEANRENDTGDGISEDIFMFKLNRNPADLMSALSHGLPLQDCRNRLQQAGYTWNLPTGGMIFVHPWQFRLCMRALVGKRTKPSTIIAAQSLEHLLQETMASIAVDGSLSWMRERDLLASSIALDSASDLAATAGEDAEHIQAVSRELFETLPHWSDSSDYIVARTFLCEATRYALGAVTCSTSDANTTHLNPRYV